MNADPELKLGCIERFVAEETLVDAFDGLLVDAGILDCLSAVLLFSTTNITSSENLVFSFSIWNESLWH